MDGLFPFVQLKLGTLRMAALQTPTAVAYTMTKHASVSVAALPRDAER
jgi:hypothetical protein